MNKVPRDPEKFYDQFLQTVEKYIPESYFEKHLSGSKKFDLFENQQFQELFKHSPAIVGVFNNVQMGYEFMSDNIETITGHPPDMFKGPHGMANVLSTFPTDHAIVYTEKVFPKLYEYFQTYANEDLKKFRFTASFQLIRKDKKVIWCMQQLNVIETDDQGLPLLVLLFMSEITHIKKDGDIDLVISRKDDLNVYQNIYAASYPTREEEILFTKRELEILALMSKGKSSNIISKELFISENTVNTHRQNMLEKSGKKNTAELLSFAVSKGFVK